ncbi:MAG: glycosyltransferase family 2 protein [Promethearchaeota archaeon]
MEKEILDSKSLKKLETKGEIIVEKQRSQGIPDLSIIIPAYNEEKTICSIATITKNIALTYGISHEIIIINDGSVDMTKEKAENCAEIVITLNENSGKGTALKRGFKASKGRSLLTIDADGSHQENDIKRVISEFFAEEVDMLIGSRFQKKVDVRFTSSMNIVGNKLFKYLIFLISGQHITDSLSGLRIFDRRVIQSMELISKDYEIESELTLKTIARNFRIIEIPITCKPRVFGSARLNSIIDGVKITKTIIYSYFNEKKRVRKSD